MRKAVLLLLFFCIGLPLAPSVSAQDDDAPPEYEGCGFGCGDACGDDEEGGGLDGIPGVEWTLGPATAAIGSMAEIEVSGDYRITDSPGTQQLMRLMGNPTGPDELATVFPEDGREWFVVFSWESIGYVPDDEKDNLDADDLLDSIKEGNKEGNRYRASIGQPAMEIIGWQMAPRYNPQTNNLEWAVKARSAGSLVVNYNVKLLGRNGVMTANLVLDPAILDETLPTFQTLLSGFAYRTGNKYSEYRKGDKLAEYGLKGLIAGGALAVAAKSGLLKHLWKLIIVVVAGIGAFLKKIFGGGGGDRPSHRYKKD